MNESENSTEPAHARSTPAAAAFSPSRLLRGLTGVDWSLATRGQRVAAGTIALLIVVLCARGWDKTLRPRGSDFTIYLDAGRALLGGQHPYTVHGYFYPPFFAVVMAPLAKLELRVASGLWQLASLLCVFSVMRAALLFLTSAPRTNGRAAAWIWCLPLWIAVRLIDSNFGYGQANLIVLGLTVAALQAWRSGRATAAGALAGIATACKVLPGILIAYWLVRGCRRSAGVGLLVTVLLVGLLPAAFLGWSEHIAGLGAWLGGDVGTLTAGGQALFDARGYPAGQSLSASAYRLLCDIPATSDLEQGPSVNLLALDPELVRLGVHAIQLALVAAVGLQLHKRALARTAPSWSVEAGLVLCTALVLGPLVHKAHLVWMLPGLAAAIALASRPREWALTLIAALAIAGSTSSLVGKELARAWLMYGGLSVGYVALWTALFAMHRRLSPPADLLQRVRLMGQNP